MMYDAEDMQVFILNKTYSSDDYVLTDHLNKTCCFVSQVQFPWGGAVPVQSDRDGVWSDRGRRSGLQDCSMGGETSPVNRKNSCKSSV